MADSSGRRTGTTRNGSRSNSAGVMNGPAALDDLVRSDARWTSHSPTPAQRPAFLTRAASAGAGLGIHGAGNAYEFGWWARRIGVRAGVTYRVRAQLRLRGVDDPNLRVMTVVIWHRGDAPLPGCPQEFLSAHRRIDGERDCVAVDEVLQAPDDATEAELLLVLRWAPEATVWWEQLWFREALPVPHREVTVAVSQGRPPAPSTAAEILRFWDSQLERATSAAPDLVCLPECLNSFGRQAPQPDVAEPLFGDTFNLLAAQARRLHAYVCGCYIVRDGDFVFNTAVLIDRTGGYVGHYRKTHLYWPEAQAGVTPGDEMPVFDTDFGRVGMMICYDSWFTEPARVLALKGAELILFPNAGHDPRLLPVRAVDNGVFIANSSMNRAASVIDPCGRLLAERADCGVTSARIDLARPPLHDKHAGGRLNSAPGGRRPLRNALSDHIFHEVVSENARWEASPPQMAGLEAEVSW